MQKRTRQLICGIVAVVFILVIIAMILTLFIYLRSCGQSYNEWRSELPNPKVYESVDFKYSVETPLGGSPGIRLEGLTEEGKTKKALVVPMIIDNIDVYWLSYYNYSPNREKLEKRGLLESKNLESIYLERDMSLGVDTVFDGCPNLKKIVFIRSRDIRKTGSVKHMENRKIYVPSKERDQTQETALAKAWDSGYTYYCGNVSYMVYERDYYWIDNFEYGEKIGYIPKSPARLGYTFTGWYKEAECINKWDFETDTLPKAKYNEKGEEVYQETKLYAGWQETEANE